MKNDHPIIGFDRARSLFKIYSDSTTRRGFVWAARERGFRDVEEYVLEAIWHAFDAAYGALVPDPADGEKK